MKEIRTPIDEPAAAEVQPRRSADILVRSNDRSPHGPEHFVRRLSPPPCCGQECPRSATDRKILATCEQFGWLEYEADRQLRFSGFGFRISFVIRHSSQV